MKVKSYAVALIVLVVIFGSVAITSYMGQWKTTTNKVPAKYSEGESAGEYNPADIRGSYTFGQIQDAFGIPADELAVAFGVKNRDNETFQVKELETIYALLAAQGKEVGTDSVRIFVAMYKGLPITLTDTTYMPKPAVEILKSKAPLSPEQLEYLHSHTIEIPESGI
jgi:hypothetical protein